MTLRGFRVMNQKGNAGLYFIGHNLGSRSDSLLVKAGHAKIRRSHARQQVLWVGIPAVLPRVSSSSINGAFLYALFGTIRLPNISRCESCYATRINNSKNYIPRDLRNWRSMPTTLLGSMNWSRTSLPCSTGILSKTVAWSKKRRPFAPGRHFGEAQAQYLSSQQTHLFECRSFRPRHSQAPRAWPSPWWVARQCSRWVLA